MERPADPLSVEGRLSLARDVVHAVRTDGRRLLFHVPTSALFELDALAAEVLDLFAARDVLGPLDLARHFERRAAPDAVAEALGELVGLGALRPPGTSAPSRPPVPVERFPLATLVLNVNTGCNLSCTYCYKEDLATPAAGKRMTLATAADAFELLLREAAERHRVNLAFFGGEPLTNLPLIREVVAYAERRAHEVGKTVDFTLTTNGTLLTDEVIAWLDAHRFGLTVSMDGPRELHDRNRRTVGGGPTYDVVVARARRLLARYRSRPVGARVTLTAGVTDVVGIHRHLRDEIGFFEVGFSPVTAGDGAAHGLDAAALAEVFAGMQRLGEDYVAAALRDENLGFSNMHQLMTDVAHGMAKALPCGAGVGMLAVDGDGGLNLCHRFTGSSLPTFGTVAGGIDRERLAAFALAAQERAGRPCETCRIRHLCAGGCYHESYARYGDPLAPVAHYCDLLRAWVDFGIAAYVRILEGNPGFFARHVEPRRAPA
ncbi:MAG TPA: quinohemoprotein amine dehydrogenase maturation protein [Candidatus Binatia bacterium]|nr:quinohemoprotein amine dehydrogenase maturation protein [Candidatus Binatia bacterium]